MSHSVVKPAAVIRNQHTGRKLIFLGKDHEFVRNGDASGEEEGKFGCI